MLRGLAGLPLVTPVIEPDARLQVVSVDDVAATVAHCLTPERPRQVNWEWRIRRCMTLGDDRRGDARLARLSAAAGRGACRAGWRGVVARLADLLGLARLAQPRALDRGARSLPRAWSAIRRPGSRRPASSRRASTTILAQRPSSVQDRWFARLYLLKPVAIVGACAVLDRDRRDHARTRAARRRWRISRRPGFPPTRLPSSSLVGRRAVRHRARRCCCWCAARARVLITHDRR